MSKSSNHKSNKSNYNVNNTTDPMDTTVKDQTDMDKDIKEDYVGIPNITEPEISNIEVITDAAKEENIEKVDVDEIKDSKTVFREGMYVVIKSTSKYTITGIPLPSYAYRNVYRIDKIVGHRIIISAHTLRFAVTENDIDLVK